jgi:hypothetical protein
VPQPSQHSRPVGMIMPGPIGVIVARLVDVADAIQARLWVTHDTQDARPIRLQHVDNCDPDASAKDLVDQGRSNGRPFALQMWHTLSSCRLDANWWPRRGLSRETVLAVPQVRVAARWISCSRAASIEIQVIGVAGHRSSREIVPCTHQPTTFLRRSRSS